ncbi:MAG: hypothetical protein R2828_25625 [Saprospiraceae bacterium]
MKIVIPIKLILILIICGCNGQSKQIETEIKKEIPTWNDGEVDLFYKLIKQKREQLKLRDLEEGFDSLQIRIWIDYSLIDFRELYTFEYQNNKWTGVYYFMRADWNSNDLTETITETERKIINPKSGWTDFSNKLLELEITALPNMRDIEGLVDGWTDGTTYNVEIGTKSNYRFYSYHLPDKFTEFWQAQNMVEILKLIEEEF